MHKYILIVLFCLFARDLYAVGLAKNPDAVDVYVVPMDDFPEDAAASIAQFMAKDMKLWVKASVRMGDLDSAKLPGTNQLIAEDILEKSQRIIHKFGDVGPNTYFLILTTQDINLRAATLRFVFAGHNKALNSSVISLQRLVNYVNGRPVFDRLSELRLYKMMKRAIGELHFGWKRSTNSKDIMYAPLMSLDDLDRLGLEHNEKAVEEKEDDIKTFI